MLVAIRSSLSFLSVKELVKYFFLLGARAISSILDVVGIALIGVITSLATKSPDFASSIDVLGRTFEFTVESIVPWLVLSVLGVFALKAFLAIALIRSMNRFLARVESQKALEIAEYFLLGSLTEVSDAAKPKIVWGVLTSVALAFSGILTSLSTLVSEGILLLLVTLAFFIVDPTAAIVVFAYFGIVIVSLHFVIGSALKKAGQVASASNMAVVEVIDDYLAAFKEIAVSNRQRFFLNKFAKARSDLSMSNATIAFLGGMPRYVVETALMLGVVGFVGWEFISGSLASGLVVIGVFLAGGVRMMASLLPMQNAAANIKNQAEQAEVALSTLKSFSISSRIINEGLSADLVLAEQDNLEMAGPVGVDILDLNYCYPGSLEPALSQIELHIAPGSHSAIIGPSGSGKTTLVDLLLGLIKPDTGEIRLLLPAGVEGRPQIAYVPQRPGLVSGTILENIALGICDDQIDTHKVMQVLEMAALGDFIKTLPQGLNTEIGNQLGSLSGGQIQRIGLARALYTNPGLLVMDEATSALDAESESLVGKMVGNLGAETTVITIAHRLSTVQHADQVILLENGKVRDQGTFKELKSRQALVANYIDLMKIH